MKHDPNCNNKKAIAHEIEKEVEGCFKNFIINVDEKDEKIDNTQQIIEESIKKSSAKVKKFYNLYVENPNENLLELIHEEENMIKNLKEQLFEEKSKEHRIDIEKVTAIRRISDVWDTLSGREKNKVLKECVERIIITGDNLEVRFIIF